LFLIYINDLPKSVSDKTIPILFADDTSILVKCSKLKKIQNNMINTFNYVYKWFRVNLLSININKTHCIQFKTENKPTTDINIVCNNHSVTTLSGINFLGIVACWLVACQEISGFWILYLDLLDIHQVEIQLINTVSILLYMIYYFDLFYFLRVLWIYGTLNKLKLKFGKNMVLKFK
jgi:hypothetical protein